MISTMALNSPEAGSWSNGSSRARMPQHSTSTRLKALLQPRAVIPITNPAPPGLRFEEPQ